MKRCIIIPAFNEEGSITEVIRDIRNYSRAFLVVIDDGSTDSTALAAERNGALVLRHPFNMGYGVALQTGYKYALSKGYDVLVQMDGDGQHLAESIPTLFKSVEEDHCDVAIGSRFLSCNSYPMGGLKAFGIKVFRQLIRLTTGMRMTDPTSGYQCLNRRVCEFFSADHFPWDYPDANVVILLNRAGFRVEEVPVEMMPNREGRSMHQGALTVSYYLFKIFLSIFLTLIRRNKNI